MTTPCAEEAEIVVAGHVYIHPSRPQIGMPSIARQLGTLGTPPDDASVQTGRPRQLVGKWRENNARWWEYGTVQKVLPKASYTIQLA